VREIVAVLITLSACAKAHREDSVARGPAEQQPMTAAPEAASDMTTGTAGAEPPPPAETALVGGEEEGLAKTGNARSAGPRAAGGGAAAPSKKGSATEAARTSGGLGTTDHPGLFEPLADDSVVIATPALAGGGDATALAQALAARRAEIGQCATKGGQGVAGTVQLAFTVQPSGKLEAVKVVRSTTKTPAVDTCIAAAVRGVAVTGSPGGKPVKGSVTIELAAR
jgi:TonB family protein